MSLLVSLAKCRPRFCPRRPSTAITFASTSACPPSLRQHLLALLRHRITALHSPLPFAHRRVLPYTRFPEPPKSPGCPLPEAPRSSR
jgi:hypothetical protein